MNIAQEICSDSFYTVNSGLTAEANRFDKLSEKFLEQSSFEKFSVFLDQIWKHYKVFNKKISISNAKLHNAVFERIQEN